MEQSARIIHWRRVPLQPETDMLVCSEEALRRAKLVAPPVPRSRNEVGQSAPSNPLQILALCCNYIA